MDGRNRGLRCKMSYSAICSTARMARTERDYLFPFQFVRELSDQELSEVLLDTYIYHLIRVQMILDTQAGFHDGRTR